MKKIIKLGFIVLLSIFFICSKAQSQKNIESSKTLLWEISGNGLSKPSYITGTFHILCNEDFEIKPKVLKALERSDNLVMEINYTDPGEVTALQKMFAADKKISEQLTPDEAGELDKILADYGTNLKNIDHYSPQALYALLSIKAVPCPPAEIKMYEMELLQNAIKNKKSIKGLEKVDEQLAFISKAYDLKSIIAQLKLSKEYEILFKNMVEAFKNEDLKTLDSLFKNDKFMNEKQEREILTNRNKNWAEKIPAIMKKESSFFAVGGAHLLGSNGLISLLKSKGYTVIPITNR